MTVRLFLTEPRRTTALARVTAVHGGWFTLDKSLFAPTSRSCRHPQPHDQGTVWWDGGKRWLEKVVDRDGDLWHKASAVPPVGAELNCHLDQDRRLLVSRAHTAMHLVLRSLAASARWTADPEVKGGGNIRLEFARSVEPRVLAEALAQANRWVAENRAILQAYEPDGNPFDDQPFQPPWSAPAGVPIVRVDGVCAYPCDGTHVARTGEVGRIVVAQVNASARGATVVFRVAAKP